jgi:hypothetical protein
VAASSEKSPKLTASASTDEKQPKIARNNSYKAVEKFEGKGSNELAVEPGDIVVVQEELLKGWVKASSNGKSGLVPFKYLEKEEPLPSDAPEEPPVPYQVLRPKNVANFQAKALYSYTGATEVELSFSKGDELTITERLPMGNYLH